MSRLPPARETDYLGSLVSRALGDPSSIGPRLPSMFEPPSTATPRSNDGVDVEERSSDPAASVTPLGLPGEPPASDPESRPERAGKPSAEPERSWPDASPSDRGRRGQESGADTLEPLAASHREPPTVRPAWFDVGDSEISGPPDDLGPDRPPGILPTTRWSMERSERPPAPTAIAADLRVVVESALEHSGALTTVVDGPAPSRDELAADQIGIMVPRAAPILPAFRPSRGRFEPATARPEGDPPRVVNVTIGRVEVRAVADHAKPSLQPTERRQPSMTLDQYLRQRAGGR